MTFHRLASFLLLCSLLLASPLRAGDVFTHISPESDRDQRTIYFRELLQLALEKTRDSFGAYELRAAPPMNRLRLRQVLETNLYPNFFAVDTPQPESGEALDYVRFPVELGILGYRICFVSPQQAKAIAGVTRFEQLKQYQNVQGRGWQDAAILRAAGLQVQEVDSYERLFKLVARGRADLFCRGANELFTELEQHRDVTGLTVDQHIALHYPFLHLLYTYKGNQAGIQRIQAGLKLAWRDGSLQQLWLRHFKPSLEQAQLPRRLLFELANPRLDKVDFDYRAYHYNPVDGTFGPGLP